MNVAHYLKQIQEVQLMWLKRLNLFVVILFAITAFHCSDNPAGPNLTSGSIKVSLRTAGSSSLLKDMAVSSVTVTSAHVVIHEIEFESLEDSLDFEFEEPFIQDLMTIDLPRVIDNIPVPFGTYKEVEIEVDELKAEDGQIYNDNPQLRNLSVLVTGYVDGDQNQSFVFTSDIDEEVEIEFDSLLTIDENTPSTQIVLIIDVNSWFIDKDGQPLDPRSEDNKSEIENNIKRSIDAFEDENDDGEDNDDEYEDESDDDDY
jgi:hypothetical protein